MTRHASPLTLLAAACAALVLLTAPAVAQQSAGGLEYGDDTTTSSPDGSFLLSRRSELLGQALTFKGTVAGTQPGDAVVVERLDRTAGWTAAASATVGAEGTFVATWSTDKIGRIAVRAVAQATGARAAATGPTRQVTVFKPAVATWYGPGFYGKRTACGQRMSRSLLGVAHKTLRCGTKVDLFYDGRTITVPVVDRGPFRGRTAWDLTAATAKRLGFTHTDTIGAARVASSAAAPLRRAR